MAYIGKTPVIGNFVKLDSITVVNGQAAYTMQNGGVNFTSYDNVNQFLVSLNGVLQAPTDSFTVSGSTLTFASNLSTGDVIDFVLVLGNSLDIGTPSDNTVTAAKIANDAVTPPKTNFFNTDPGNAADLGNLHIKSADSGASVNSGHNQVVAENSGNSGMSILSGNTSNGAICFGDDGNNCIGYINYAHNGNDLSFGVNNAERMLIDSDGVVKFTNTPPIKSFDFGSCSVTIANGSYIDFPSTSGVWILTETVGTGQTGVLASGGGATAVIGQTGSIYSNSSSSGSIRFFNNSGTSSYRLQNNYGITVAFGICHISTRAST